MQWKCKSYLPQATVNTQRRSRWQKRRRESERLQQTKFLSSAKINSSRGNAFSRFIFQFVNLWKNVFALREWHSVHYDVKFHYSHVAGRAQSAFECNNCDTMTTMMPLMIKLSNVMHNFRSFDGDFAFMQHSLWHSELSAFAFLERLDWEHFVRLCRLIWLFEPTRAPGDRLKQKVQCIIESRRNTLPAHMSRSFI